MHMEAGSGCFTSPIHLYFSSLPKQDILLLHFHCLSDCFILFCRSFSPCFNSSLSDSPIFTKIFLVQTWPPRYCSMMMKCTSKLAQFLIHGPWPVDAQEKFAMNSDPSKSIDTQSLVNQCQPFSYFLIV